MNANANVNALIDKIVDDAEKKVRTDLKYISSKAKNDFFQKAREVVLLYYSNYIPQEYQRTDNLKKNVVDDSLSFSMLNGNGYGAWIQFNSDNMDDYALRSKDEVVSNFMEGVHGKRSIQVDSPNAMDLMDAFQSKYKRTTLDGYFRSLGYKVN